MEPEQAYCPGCGTEMPATAINGPEIPSEQVSPSAPQTVRESWRLSTPKQWRIFELVLVCGSAFAISILTSGERFFTGNYATNPTTGEMVWVHSILRQILGLGLLWYVLQRRSQTFRDLGLRWSLKEVAFGCLLFLGKSLIYVVWRGLIIAVMMGLRLKTVSHPNVDRMLFGSHVAVTAIIFQFINPFFEELIVRAFAMTELKALTNSTAIAVIASVLLQTSYHFYQGPVAALSHIPTFLLFSLYYAKTNRIGAPIVAHLLWDLFSTVNYMTNLAQYHS